LAKDVHFGASKKTRLWYQREGVFFYSNIFQEDSNKKDQGHQGIKENNEINIHKYREIDKPHNRKLYRPSGLAGQTANRSKVLITLKNTRTSRKRNQGDNYP